MGRFATRNGFGDFDALQRWSVPVKRILRGAEADSVASRGALLDSSATYAFVQFREAKRRRA